MVLNLKYNDIKRKEKPQCHLRKGELQISIHADCGDRYVQNEMIHYVSYYNNTSTEYIYYVHKCKRDEMYCVQVT